MVRIETRSRSNSAIIASIENNNNLPMGSDGSWLLDSHLVASHSAPLLAQLHQDAENLLPAQQLPAALAALSIQEARLQNQAPGAVWDDELTRKVTQMMDTSLIAHDRPITEVLAHDHMKKAQQNTRPTHHQQTSQKQTPDQER